MDRELRLQLVREVGEEIVTEDELRQLLETKAHPIAYDGFEPSGTDIHIAQGLLRAINVNKMVNAGIRFKMLVADWHAWANNKMGGDLEKIQTVGRYYVELWKVCGMDLGKVEFVWASELLHSRDYWKTVMEVARQSTLKRILRTVQIMGRSESDALQASQILYPCMQAADIFHLGADITQLGMDQRKVNVLAREIGPKMGYWAPVMVSHHMLMGLGEPKANVKDAKERAIALKMSKSKPETAVFMNDSAEDVMRKIEKAYCPEGQVADNPLLEYCRYILFAQLSALKVERPAKFGGDAEFRSYPDLENAFAARELHPKDLKKAVAAGLNSVLSPIRKKLEANRTVQDLLSEIRTFKVTR